MNEWNGERGKQKRIQNLTPKLRYFPVAPDTPWDPLSPLYHLALCPRRLAGKDFTSTALLASVFLGLIHRRHQEENTEQEDEKGASISPVCFLQGPHRYAVSPSRVYSSCQVALSGFLHLLPCLGLMFPLSSGAGLLPPLLGSHITAADLGAQVWFLVSSGSLSPGVQADLLISQVSTFPKA